MIKKTLKWVIAVGFAANVGNVFATAPTATTLMNVSYDVTRELYKDYNVVFTKHWKEKTGEAVTINMSHGGSSKQAGAVVNGLPADVISMNQANDIDILAERGKLIPANWATRLPNNSAPYTSTMVFIVRKGNPQKIKDWNDLVKPGVKVIIPNPKTAGNGRYTYLAAWGNVVKHGGNEGQAREFVSKLFKNVPILDAGGRAATSTFVQRNIGDVLVTFENEALQIQKEFGAKTGGGFEVVYPNSSILTESPVTVVDKVVEKHNSRKLATAYLEYLYSPEGQEVVAKHYYRPRSAEVLKKYAKQFPQIKLFTVSEVFGSWKNAQKVHFNDGGIFDQIFKK